MQISLPGTCRRQSCLECDLHEPEPWVHTFHIYRYDPDADARPRMQTQRFEVDSGDRVLLARRAV